MRLIIVLTWLALILDANPQVILATWHRNQETFVNQYRIHVKTTQLSWQTNYPVIGSNHLTVATNALLLLPPDYPTNSIPTSYAGGPRFKLPAWSWNNTNALLKVALTAVSFDGVKSEFSDTATVTNRPGGLTGLIVVQVGGGGHAELGFTDLPERFRIDWAENLQDWRQLASVEVHDTAAWPQRVWWVYPVVDAPKAFWRLVELP